MSNFAKTYFNRFQSNEQIIQLEPENDLFLTIVMPAFNEGSLCTSLQSIAECNIPKGSVEVIVIINAAENCPPEIVQINRNSFQAASRFAEENSQKKLQFHILNFENFPIKFAGVGLARKTGMDEALRRFDLLNKPQGLIAGFDADALVEKNYLTEIENHFSENENLNACSIHFEHPIKGNDYSEDVYIRIINYELHLRYLNESLRFAGFPYAYHTIGSSFVLRADVYAKQGGMNRKKAGEDFYFLQKIIPLGNYGEINSTTVIPSPRISDRVPFGTGAAIKKMTDSNTYDFLTYDFKVFEIIKSYIAQMDSYYTNFDSANLDNSLRAFLNRNSFDDALFEIRKNSPNIKIFRKRFFNWFNAFRIIKYLNYAHTEYFAKQPVKSQADLLLNNYFSANFKQKSEKDQLLFLREIQKQSKFYINL